MQVKCYLAQGDEVDKNMMELLALTDERGQNSLGGLANDIGNISLSKTRGALILTGGRESITRFLYNQGSFPLITGGRPFLVSFARKHRIFGKNETCVKIVSGTGHRQPTDGSEYQGINGLRMTRTMELLMTSSELSHSLWAMYGWG